MENTCLACREKDTLIKALVGSAIQPTIRDGAAAYRCLLCEWTWPKGAEPSHDIESGCPLAGTPAAEIEDSVVGIHLPQLLPGTYVFVPGEKCECGEEPEHPELAIHDWATGERVFLHAAEN